MANRKRLKLQCIECIAKSALVIHMVHMQHEQSIHVGATSQSAASIFEYLSALFAQSSRRCRTQCVAKWINCCESRFRLDFQLGIKPELELEAINKYSNSLDKFRKVFEPGWLSPMLDERIAEFIGPRGSDRVLKWPQQVERTRWRAKELWILNMLVVFERGFP